jgi:arylsulfatase A-like enzyme
MGANVLFVVFDTARADVFEPYGARPGATPAIAELAGRGCAHPAAYAPSSWTVPSHASMFSGQLPRSAGFQHRGTTSPKSYREANRVLAQRGQTLPVVLQRAGYETAALTGNTWVGHHTGFDQGFDDFRVVSQARPGRLHRTGLRDRLAWRMDAVRAKLDDGASETADLLADWVSRPDRRPFFWFINLIECHSPYMPPKPWNPLGPIDRWRAAAEASEFLTMGSIWRCSLGGFDVPDGAMDRMRRLYTAGASQLDAWTARVLELLDQHGLVDETQVILTSDHGENLGEDKLLGHAFSLDDRLLRVPMVTAGPATLDPAGVFRLSQLPAFVAEAAGDGHPDRCLAGVAQWNLPDGGVAAAALMGRSMTCATDGRLKLLRPIGTGARAAGLPPELLVDLRSDPLEQRPAPPSADQEVALRAELRLLRDALDRAAELERPKTPVPADGGDDGAEDERLSEQLRHLGYL